MREAASHILTWECALRHSAVSSLLLNKGHFQRKRIKFIGILPLGSIAGMQHENSLF